MRFSTDMKFARELDRQDVLSRFRKDFHFPTFRGKAVVYLCGNSLGLMPKPVKHSLLDELKEWERLGVRGHYAAKAPWYSYQDTVREAGARLIGAKSQEVVFMNSLTVNLHLMLSTFYRPKFPRHKILIEYNAFPSDRYAAMSHIKNAGYSVKDSLLIVQPSPGRKELNSQNVLDYLERFGNKTALVLLPGVQYYSGQVFDMQEITRAAHEKGCLVGFDLAHAIGNLEMKLHDWNVDFAVWCTYKYLNSGPGSVGGCFVHEKHGQNIKLHRLAGWFGNNPRTRFKMPFDFVPIKGAAGWMLSNQPVLSMASLCASLRIFEKAGMKRLKKKSVMLTSYLEFLIREKLGTRVDIITPSGVEERGSQISLRIKGNADRLKKKLEKTGVICDYRSPDIIRAAPVPLYNSFLDVWTFVERLKNISYI